MSRQSGRRFAANGSGFLLVVIAFIGYAPIMQMQWRILQPDRLLVQEIQQGLQCHPVTAAILANRKVDSLQGALHFMQPSLENLPNPATLHGITKAVDRIVRALCRQEKIMVFGDYDADGITATAVMVNFLKAAGADVFYHLPHRVDEGYGLAPMHIMELAVPQRTALIITVDCGSSSFDAVAAANRFGIDVIISDHHNIDGSGPDALAVINPKMADQPTELSDLAGVGVAFYLVIALRAALRSQGWWQHRPEPNLKAYCDLVAIGTVADMVSLRGVNRVLARAGLNQINKDPRPGIKALLNAAGIRHTPINAEDISFRLGPRINAAGRVAHPRIAFDLLNASCLQTARPLAEDLNVLNNRRQETENEIYAHIIDNLENRRDWDARNALLMAGCEWHEGVLGIVAARLVARYHRPVVVLSTRNGMAKGSGRSVPQVDLHAALTQCAHLIERFGGHRMAAGLSVRSENVSRLQHTFEAVVTQMLQDQPICHHLDIDSEIDLGEISNQLVDEIESLSPFGTDNPQPLFMARDISVTTAVMVGRAHRRMVLCQPNACTPPMTAIQFNIDPDCPRANWFDRLAFRLQWNRYRGGKQIQLVVEAF
jgi:single-stranded-DNA-specific exonuclease